MKLKYKGHHVYTRRGVVGEKGKYKCLRCSNNQQNLFYTFKDLRGLCTYCLNCIALGRSDSLSPIFYEDTTRYTDHLNFTLNFELNSEQQHASDRIVSAIQNNHDLMLYAVTGAGKTEITFRGIEYARNNGLNVAFVSPRVDVVREIYMRLKDAFVTARIDLLYADEKIETDFVFTVCTVHQLYNFIEHFDVIIVDEVDAFPLDGDKILEKQIRRALTKNGSCILLTATPNRALLSGFKNSEIVTIKRRYHGYKLTVPEVIYRNIEKQFKKNKLDKTLKEYLDKSVKDKRKVLIFVPEIRMLAPFMAVLKHHYSKIDYVYSGDQSRKQKVEEMRNDTLDILVTTTILERGVTFKCLDVYVVHAEYFDSASLVQIAGRAGRKIIDPVGHVYLFTSHNTLALLKTRHTIRKLNKGEV
ncbi:DEAD/DEAH box helicase family protein [Phocicoccus pinnipedialis]|uniref:ATP-dependent DNA helicase RecG n=1 Tax=Phocicoccus pinnipedialis TaxID=110845 RepID=A0A6V7R131_9BACL|nr:DEAD/DEAH box helicase family protein [Jeotgalicoccus pinnipedialis]MBP1938778.1 competence protein ComFA [Jeotgalicoccus pinnipedialis]CAD2070774.1 ATP-dependent DNA helicase RecG [Jeotgalicoccus pinnipedialis]